MMTEQVGMLIDVSKCMGCRGCQVACKQWNQLPASKTKFGGTYQNPPKLSSTTWTLIHFVEPAVVKFKNDPAKQRAEFNSNPEWLFRKQQCLHCLEPACVTACPTGALRKQDNGIVYINQESCAGCKYCIEACPFETPHPDPNTGTARKCWMCFDRVKNGMVPACVTACPTGAVQFGTRAAMLSLAKKRAAVLRKEGKSPYIYGEKELGGLGVLTLLPVNDPELYDLPKDPKQPTDKIFIRWVLGLIPGFALLLAMWHFFMKPAAAEGGKQ
jgi:formate dehydrogenase iron-sulfur subunit